MELTETQQKIVNTKGNLIVSASAGTGKTHTMVAKIEKEIHENKDFRVVAAITFTIKAAKEIKNRLSVDTTDHFIGTNNSFAIEEVIKPFMRDAFGADFDREMTTDYNKKFDEFSKGLIHISASGLLGSYQNGNQNFIFELALKILKKSEVARLYLQAKYFKIYIDEYQDCDYNMNEFFMYLTESLHIDLFIVGDDKQSLYIWRGAKPEAFRSILEKSNFKNIFMMENFRSNKQIQNYSNLLFDKTANLYQPQFDKNSIILLKCTHSDWVGRVKNFWDSSKSTGLLRGKNVDAENGSNLLVENDMDFKFIPKAPIENISNDTAWLYYSIAEFIILDNYSVFDFMYDIPSGLEENSKTKRKLEVYLDDIKSKVSDENSFKMKVSDVATLLGYSTQEEDLDCLFKTVSDKKYIDIFETDKYLHKAMTCHSSKGLQFDQVILFAEDFSLKKQDDFYLHYVAVTRAKSKIIIIDTGTYWAKQFNTNICKKLTSNKVPLEDLLITY
ncbi:MAG TPA: ATP-dependent helicase [Lactovum miscens]|uniref:ATP-dependent helicase n=1 Tax=Lactovum miscens TaxID=190387 RepID=UPI002EDAC5C7